MHISLYTLQEWSRKFNWAKRVKEYEEVLDEGKYQQKMASLANIAQLKTFSLYMGILDNPKAKASDKIKAAEKLQQLVEKTAELKDLKKIVIKFYGLDDFVEKLKRAGVKVIEKEIPMA